jgi:hypothetical protein
VLVNEKEVKKMKEEFEREGETEQRSETDFFGTRDPSIQQSPRHSNQTKSKEHIRSRKRNLSCSAQG